MSTLITRGREFFKKYPLSTIYLILITTLTLIMVAKQG